MDTAPEYRFEKSVQAQLCSGDKFTQKEFHDVYETMPEGFRAELLGGVVYVCQPLGLPHGSSHVELSCIFRAYTARTTGVEVFDNVTTILGEDDEVQPDLTLRVSPRFGGQSTTTYQNFISGAPELVAEIAHSSRAIDMHIKRYRYKKAGVVEYIVLCLQPLSVQWFSLPDGKQLQADSDGIFKSETFPGLWIDANALMTKNYERYMDVLSSGLESPEHRKFVEKLQPL